ncbi:hypothetical protein LOC54_09165 [Acetobacter sp. AN02]|uniref:hypothetical protein n=1 Tax=Acetobacter sp. AN02 TaxID=2894186 RepID=UPI0024344DE1|nr:hypothetical protein [Acetobacter sp. AN02]MDG6095270.1 hypothetical protein [Acetobacter sp. AN02]
MRKRDIVHVDFSDVVLANSGNIINHEKYIEQKQRFDALFSRSYDLANRLEYLGIPAFQQEQDITKIGLITGIEKQAERAFRHILLIPSVMQQDRQDLVRSLNYFIEHDFFRRSKNLRYAVITCENVPFFGDLKATHSYWSRKVSDTFRDLNKLFGIKIQLRTTEITINNTDESINLHMNILYEASRYITNKQGGWGAVSSYMYQNLRCRIHDGIVQSPKKAISYILKPFDVSSMSNASLPWLANEMHGMRLVQKYNDFQQFSAGLRNNRQRIIFKNDTKDFVRIQKRRVVDNNSLIENDEEYEISKTFFDDANTERPHFKRTTNEDAEQRKRDEKQNEILGVMMPHCYAVNITEPVILVRNRDYKDASFTFFLNDLRRSLKSKISNKLNEKLRDNSKETDKIINDMYIQNITNISELWAGPISLTHKRHLTEDTPMYYSVEGAGGSAPPPLPDLIDIYDIDDLEPTEIPDSEYFEDIEEVFGLYTGWINHHPSSCEPTPYMTC